MSTEFNLVVVCDEDNIFCEDKVLDKLVKDEDFNSLFYHLFANKATIIGRKTWVERYEKNILGKICVIMSQKEKIEGPMIGSPHMLLFADSWMKGQAFCRRLSIGSGNEHKKVFILGGCSILQQAMSFVDNIYMFQFYGDNNSNKVLKLNDDEWYPKVFAFSDNFDFIRFSKRTKVLDEFSDPTER